MAFRPRPPSPLEQFLGNPSLFLAKWLYANHQPDPLFPPISPCDGISHPLTVVCISDTHNRTPYLPPGDILIHAGDLTNSGTAAELQAQLDWLAAQPHHHKVMIAGNHDLLLDPSLDRSAGDRVERQALNWHDITYLEDIVAELCCPPSCCSLSGGGDDGDGHDHTRIVRVFGSPRTPKFGNWAFQHSRGNASEAWATAAIPDAVDVLVTHGPPLAHADMAGIGCPGLLREMWRVRPQLMVCGHVHAARGVEVLTYDGVQAQWEALVRARGGLANLCWLAWKLLQRWSWGWWTGHRAAGSKNGKTLLVNAAHIGGMRDELRRDPIAVVI